MQNYDNQLIKKYIEESTSFAEVLRKLDIDPRGRNYNVVKDAIDELSIDISHFLGKAHFKNTKQKTIPWSEILVKNSHSILGTDRKRRLIKEGLLQNRCYGDNCGINSWLGKSLSLQLDHINGDNTDNRIENIRLLCPNCHSQTETFCGKNTTKSKKNKGKNICKCGKPKAIQSQMCQECFNKTKFDKLTKITWPSNDDLVAMVNGSNIYQVSKKLGVSFHAVKKRLKNRGLL
jgi:hypothetical protein